MAKTIFWFSLFTIFYSYFGYSILCVILGFLFGKKTAKREGFLPAISLIIPCYNEENVIKDKIENILSLDYPRDKLQIIIASESNDSTNRIAEGYSGRGIELYSSPQRKGKPSLLFNTASAARGEILVFSDANAMFKPDALKQLTANFSDSSVGAVIGALNINNPGQSSISRGEFLYKQYESVIRNANSRMGRVLNADGSIFAVRKRLYSPISEERGDDFELTLRVLIKGYRCVFEPLAFSYEEAATTARNETARKIRMVSWFLKSAVILMGEMLRGRRFDLLFQIISHKILRWFMPYFFISLFFSNLILWNNGLAYQLSLLVQALVYLGGILGCYIAEFQKKKPHLALGILYYFIIFNYAFLIGTLKGTLSAHNSSSWEKVRP